MTYFQTKAVFENVFYGLLGIIAVLLISSVYQIPVVQTFLIVPEPGAGIILPLLKVLLEVILLAMANLAAIFVCSGIILPSLSKFRKSRKVDFTESWMETYIRLSPMALAFTIAFVPVLGEELFFRVLINLLLLESFAFANWPSGDIVLSASISTIFFVFQQSIMLKNRLQMLSVGIGAFWIGIISSVAFILGASFYSILFSHYIFVVFTIISARQGRKQGSLRELQ
jgi:hypothetical protein